MYEKVKIYGYYACNVPAAGLMRGKCGHKLGNESEEPEEKKDAAPPSGEPEKEEMKFDYGLRIGKKALPLF